VAFKYNYAQFDEGWLCGYGAVRRAKIEARKLMVHAVECLYRKCPVADNPAAGPFCLIAKKHGRDMRQCVPLVYKAGTLCIFTNFTWHSASAYVREDGQRFYLGLFFWSCRSLLGGF